MSQHPSYCGQSTRNHHHEEPVLSTMTEATEGNELALPPNGPNGTTGSSSVHVPVLVQSHQSMPVQFSSGFVGYLHNEPHLNHPYVIGWPLLPATSLAHNLIPGHLQQASNAAYQNQIHLCHGTPGHQPALINPGAMHQVTTTNTNDNTNDNTNMLPLGLCVNPSPPMLPPQPLLTVQDRPMVPPVFNGVNPNYPGLRVLNASPPVFVVDNFLTPGECDFLIHSAIDAFSPAPVVGKGAGEISPSRTSTTYYLAREDLPDLLRKVTMLTSKPAEHCELPQVGRYLPSQQYKHHFDAFDLSNEDGQRCAANGGQRTVTVLIYLNDVSRGGQTAFPTLNLEVQPRKGMAVVFFPATVDGLLDKMALHAALPAVDPKFVSQVWIRQGEYKGHATKVLPRTMGTPFGMESNEMTF